jgi:endonuclease YncB( thermonuclease family)
MRVLILPLLLLAAQAAHAQSADSGRNVRGAVIAPAGVSFEVAGQASVTDGDTIEIKGQRIRLFGIDAPEGGQTCQDSDGQEYRCGQRAALALDEEIASWTVFCDQRDVDQYGRIVAVCHAQDKDLNAWLVREGYAVAYREFSSDYVDEEQEAREAKRGLWNGMFINPANYRRSQ